MPRLDPHESLLRRMLWPTWNTRKRLLTHEAWLVLAISYPVIAFGFLWPTDFRDTRTLPSAAAWAAFMVRTFLFHAGLVYLAVAIFAAATRTRRLLAACVPLLGVCLGPALLEFLPRSPARCKGETITVMSVNLLMVNRNTDATIEEIRSMQPDLLLLQEYTEHWHEALRAALGVTFPHYAYETREDSFGAAIYSRRPFLEPVQLALTLGGIPLPQVRGVIEVSGTPVAVYNIHLLPPRTLPLATRQRQATGDLADVLRAERLPAIVSGDFNFTQDTAHYRLLTGTGLTEAHRAGGWGRGTTWPVISWFRYLPGLRLDRIFVSQSLTAVECRTGEGGGSDHRPVMARVGLRDD